MKQHKIIIGTISKGFREETYLLKDDVLKLINELPNPYPEDIFPKLELSEFQTQTINDFLLSNLRFPLDRLSAELMRRARENLKEELKSKINGENRK